MAIVYRDTERYVIETAYKKLRTLLSIIIIVSPVLTMITGYMAALKNLIFIITFIPIIYIMIKLMDRKLNDLKKEETNYIKGAKGEIATGFILETLLPDTYNLLYSIPTGHGDIDLLVIGPTGVYGIDVKNWKSRITLDNDLKTEMYNFRGRCKKTREKIQSNYYKKELKFINCIIAFTTLE